MSQRSPQREGVVEGRAVLGASTAHGHPPQLQGLSELLLGTVVEQPSKARARGGPA